MTRRWPWQSPADQPRWARPALLAIAGLAAMLYLWGIGTNQMQSNYYGAAVYSMSKSWHAFLHGGFDPAASITIDKIPLAFQVQALFVRVFGYHNWVLVLPQAIAGMLAVLVLYRVVRRWAGPAAGLLAALILTLTPITAALNRAAQADALLVLLLVLAADAWQRAVDNGRLRPLLFCGLWVGAAFHVKMVQAWAVLPAFAIGYLLAAPGPLLRRFGRLAAAGAVTLAASSVWILLVTLTPAGHRPYVDGSTDNSAIGMVFGYNFFKRFTALSEDTAGVGGLTAGPGSARPGTGGPSQWLSLLTPNTASQFSWLLPLAGLAAVLGLLSRWRAPRTDPLRAGFVMWGVWLATHLVAFTIGSIAHTFYTAVLAPSIGALCAAGLVLGWRALRTGSMWAWALPAGVVVTAAWAVHLGRSYPEFMPWLAPTAVVSAAVAVVALAAAILWRSTRGRRFAVVGTVVAVASALVSPASWAASTTQGYGGNAIGPSAGPTTTFPSGGFGGGFGGPGGQDAGGTRRGGPAGGGGGFAGGPGGGPGMSDGGGPGGAGAPGGGPGMGGGGVNQALVAFLKAHQGTAKYAVAISGANVAGPYLIAGLSVLPMGGFTGQAPFPSTAALRDLVTRGELRYILGNTGNAWVAQNCSTVDASIAGGGTATLYDCAGNTR